ncbi:helix-turn-helix domain-containing protein, partial [Streptococcus pyogenes]
MTTIAERIKCVRTDKGLTVKDFAKILDVSTTTVNNYEKGLR